MLGFNVIWYDMKQFSNWTGVFNPSFGKVELI